MTDVRNIDQKQFNTCKSWDQKISFLLQYAIMAPSTHNTQPWLFSIHNNICDVFYDDKRILPEADPNGRDFFISLGAAIENFRIAAEYFGVFGWTTIKHDENNSKIAELVCKESSIQKNPSEEISKLFSAIPKRINARGEFTNKSIAINSLDDLSIANEFSELTVHFITESNTIISLANITEQGVKIAHSNPKFRKELVKWFHNNFSSSRDGLLGYTLGMSGFVSILFPYVIRWLNLGNALSKINKKSVESAPLICIISAQHESPEVCTKVGMLGERLMLAFTSIGLNCSIYAAAIEIENLQSEVQNQLGTSLLPQWLICVGEMKTNQKISPRHLVATRLINKK
jgi:hypothetical protein